MGWTILLVAVEEQLPLSELRRSEVRMRLCCFVSWLRLEVPPLAAGTIAAYVGHVRSRHTQWLGGAHFNAVIGATYQVSQMIRSIRKQRPASKKKKVPFTVVLLERLFQACRMKIVSSSPATFAFTRDFMVMAVSLYMLCRLSEVTNTAPMSQANAFPIMYSDLHFFTVDHEEVRVQPNGKIPAGDWERIDYVRTRYPPSKADPFSFNSDLFIPCSSAGRGRVTAFDAIRFMMVCYPVRAEHRARTPLFRDSLRAGTVQVRDSVFMNGFRIMCRAASIRYAPFGKHSFRVGGMNALQDRNASVSVIMAAGHWASDAWAEYSRRNQGEIMSWTRKMGQP